MPRMRVLMVRVRVQVRVHCFRVQVQVQVLKICTRVLLEYEYEYQVLQLCHSRWRHSYTEHTSTKTLTQNEIKSLEAPFVKHIFSTYENV